jgi:hypothetical protein
MQAFGECFNLKRQLQWYYRIKQLGKRATMTGDVLCNPEPRLILARLQVGSRGRTNRASIELREPHSLTRHPIHVRRFIERVAVTTNIGPSKIISQDQNDVGPLRSADPT